ncbi:MAG TPA: DUF72 domain-containing protein [Candidatus Binataceae bacterium]|nr:DUF72 domain-containing protein [Candidatus Binataceae bacterium]
MAREFLVGTASWTDPTLVKTDLFYPPDAKTAAQRLAFYASHFPTVEVDSSYYAILSEDVVRLWAERTPPGFVFNVKAFAWMTQHPAETKRLPTTIKSILPENLKSSARVKSPPAELLALAFQMFWSSLKPLRDAGKMGWVLFQLPPYVTYRKSNLEYLGGLSERLPGGDVAVEFRHPSWTDSSHRTATLDFLRDRGLAYVSTDAPAQSGLVSILSATTSDAYIRFHGRSGETWFKRNISAAERFKYLYAERELAEWAGRIKQLGGVRRAFAIFNNCYSNFGIMNATTMREMLSRPEP